MSNIATLEDYKRNVAQKLEDLEVQVTQLYEREDHVLSHTQTYTGWLNSSCCLTAALLIDPHTYL